ncbi:MAG: septum formation inhibitor Maf [Helicobacteraceae bacterium]|jgi:septum formation protein|nr:septum formation inhibitor Maf [Helicobacteraceae bacterium]
MKLLSFENAPIILASASPSRAALLKNAGVAFESAPSDFDEDSLGDLAPFEFVYRAAIGKAKIAIARFGEARRIIAADTVVSARNKLLRKAVDRADAKAKLLLQSGGEVAIVTCSVFHSRSKELIDVSQTRYRFAPFEEGDLESYLDSGDWRGKAGAIMVEGFAKPYIRYQKGSTNCALGLTIEAILPFIRRAV